VPFLIVGAQKVESVLLPQIARSKPSKRIILKRRSDFLKTYKGLNVRMKFLVLYLRPNGQDCHRVGVTVPKTVGSAVIRNRYKRWCREIIRKVNFDKFSRTFDINIFVGNKKVKRIEFENHKFQEFRDELQKAWDTALSRYC
jgi:ribonuclease P protein component